MKKIIIDKSSFEALTLEKLCDIAQHNTLIITWVLCVECLRTQTRNRRQLLEKIQKIVRCGAKISFPPHNIVKFEREHRQAFGSVISEEDTAIVSELSLPMLDSIIDEEAQKYEEIFKPVLDVQFELSNTLHDNTKKSNLLKGIRTEDDNVALRLEKWNSALNQMMPSLIEQYLSEIKEVVTEDWFVWHTVKLRWILGFEQNYHICNSGDPPTQSRS